jgi:hypothetical protein
MTDYRELLASTDEGFAEADPLVMNLLVAKSIPRLAYLDVPPYARVRDSWAEAIEDRLPKAERHFWRNPGYWKNDLNFFRLGVLCDFVENEAGIAYNEDQRAVASVRYTDPSDLFLDGMMDSRRGTCANMAALHVALGWRLGWPVSLACVRAHLICRYDDGRVTHNIEATQSGYGGFKSDPDDYLIRQYGLPPGAVSSGSDLRALRPREVLGVFIAFRGRHMRDTGNWEQAELDYLLARHLFPTSRRLHLDAMAVTALRAADLFDPGEIGAPEMHIMPLQRARG